MSHDRYTHFHERDDDHDPWEAENLPGYNQYERMGGHHDNDEYVRYSPRKKETIKDIERRDANQFPIDPIDEHTEMQRIKADRKRNSKASMKKKKNQQGFSLFPSKMNRQHRGRASESLRVYISFLMLAHFCFIAIEIFVYHGL